MDQIKELVVETLRGAHQCLEENDWTRLVAARDVDGNPCHPFAPIATQFCLLGAIQKSSDEVEELEAKLEQAILSDESDSLQKFIDYSNEIMWGAMLEVQTELENTFGPNSDETEIRYYNDFVAINKEEILNMLQETIERIKLDGESNNE